jgi:hypothetical protein
MTRSSIDPVNNQLIRHVCRVNSMETNPELVDVSDVRLNLDWGQSGWNRAHDQNFMRSAAWQMNTGNTGLVSLSRDMITTTPTASTSQIHIPPGHNLLLSRVRYQMHIEEYAWQLFCGNQHRILKMYLSTNLPDGNSVGRYVNMAQYVHEFTINQYQNIYEWDSRVPAWLPEGSSATAYVTCDNNLQGVTNLGGSWRIAGNGIDIPVHNPVGNQIAVFGVDLWGILVPHGVQPPAACQR